MLKIGTRLKRNFDKKRTYIENLHSGKSYFWQRKLTGCEQYDIRDENDLNYRAYWTTPSGGWNYDEITYKDEFNIL